jgi:hypothetical protein
VVGSSVHNLGAGTDGAHLATHHGGSRGTGYGSHHLSGREVLATTHSTSIATSFTSRHFLSGSAKITHRARLLLLHLPPPPV